MPPDTEEETAHKLKVRGQRGHIVLDGIELHDVLLSDNGGRVRSTSSKLTDTGLVHTMNVYTSRRKKHVGNPVVAGATPSVSRAKTAS